MQSPCRPAPNPSFSQEELSSVRYLRDLSVLPPVLETKVAWRKQGVDQGLVMSVRYDAESCRRGRKK